MTLNIKNPNITYNQIIDSIEEFSTNHLMINSFYSGKTWNFEAKENVYPSLIILPVSGNIVKGKTDITFNKS